MTESNVLNISIIDKIKNILFNAVKSSDEVVDINIPKNVLIRTKLLCRYIEEEQDVEFDLNNFLMLIYLDFVKTSIKTYDPEKIFKMLTKDYLSNNKILLSNGTDSCYIEKNKTEFSNITITIEKKDYEYGQMILDEIYDLYKYRISYSHLLESLWMDFMECYKNGTKKRAFKTIIKLLKDCFN